VITWFLGCLAAYVKANAYKVGDEWFLSWMLLQAWGWCKCRRMLVTYQEIAPSICWCRCWYSQDNLVNWCSWMMWNSTSICLVLLWNFWLCTNLMLDYLSQYGWVNPSCGHLMDKRKTSSRSTCGLIILTHKGPSWVCKLQLGCLHLWTHGKVIP
jgi:hypothetical protein